MEDAVVEGIVDDVTAEGAALKDAEEDRSVEAGRKGCCRPQSTCGGSRAYGYRGSHAGHSGRRRHGKQC